MSKLRVACYSLSLDGFGAGPDQSLEDPLGKGAMALHQWIMGTRPFRQNPNAPDTMDDEFVERGFENIGSWILGRNMFTPSRGPWTDDGWQGWWGEEPPYHCDVFVLTHHARPPLEMKGGTTFHFITEGIHEALDRARKSADGKDVRLGGGAATIRQYLKAGLIDEMHLAYAPVMLGAGESLLAGIDLPALGFSRAAHASTQAATHIVLSKS